MDSQLVTVINETELEPTKAEIILSKFSGFLDEARKWESEAKKIIITDASQKVEMAKARSARLALKNIRVNAENVRKELKENALREGKAIDGIANIIKAVIVPIEEHLEKQEKFVEMQIEAEKEKLNSERIVSLSQYIADVSMYNLKDMSVAGFNELLSNAKLAHDARVEAEKKAEAERLSQEKAKQEEYERNKAEVERLKKEAEEKAKEQAKLKAEQDKKLKAEQEAREKLEAELKSKKVAEEKSKKEAEEKAKAEAEAKRQSELAPDKDKLISFSEQIKALKAPKGLSVKAQKVANDAEKQLLEVAQSIILNIKNI